MSLRLTLRGEVKFLNGAEAKASVNSAEWRAQPLRAENRLDELWLGVKDQSNSVIAGSLRNSFRASLVQ